MDQLARSLTIPLLFIDEVAFIRNIDRIYAAALPTLSTAREQAIKHGYPYWLLFASTPNGSEGIGKFFHDMWSKAISSDLLFQPTPDGLNEKFVDNDKEIISDPNRNSFTKVKYHWSEDSRKDKAWYDTMCQEFNHDERKINQELDLAFVGASNCIFSDSVLKKLDNNIKKPLEIVSMPHQSHLKLFQKIEPSDYLIIGVDTASSVKGAYSAIEVFGFKNFEQIGEVNIKFGSLVKYGEVVDKVFRYLNYIMGGRIIIAIENNSIGKAIVEHLQYHVKDFDYTSFMYFEPEKVDSAGRVKEYGINTNSRTKDLMVTSFYEFVTEGPEYFYSEDLITQLNGITRNNAGHISHTSYSD